MQNRQNLAAIPSRPVAQTLHQIIHRPPKQLDLRVSTNTEHSASNALLVRTNITSQYSSFTPPQRYNIVRQLELCVNCLSLHHLRTTCVSNNRCYECNGFHHTSLYDPNKFKKSTFVVNAHHDLFHKTMHPTLQEPVWGSDNFCKPAPQETQNFNQQSAYFNQKSKKYKPKSRRFPNQPDLRWYDAQHSNKSEYQLSKQRCHRNKTKDAACAENQGGFTACEFLSFCSEEPQCLNNYN